MPRGLPLYCAFVTLTVSVTRMATIATTTVWAATGYAGAKNSSLDFEIDIRPDGSTTGGTIFLTNPANTEKYRVLVYQSTGSSYARQGW